MTSMGSAASMVVRRSIGNLAKVTEPEVSRTRYTLVGLVVAVLAIGLVELLWLRSAVERLSSLTTALTHGG